VGEDGGRDHCRVGGEGESYGEAPIATRFNSWMNSPKKLHFAVPDSSGSEQRRRSYSPDLRDIMKLFSMRGSR